MLPSSHTGCWARSHRRTLDGRFFIFLADIHRRRGPDSDDAGQRLIDLAGDVADALSPAFRSAFTSAQTIPPLSPVPIIALSFR